MSSGDAKRTPLDPQLPEELARCESWLAGMSLPPSRIARDELIYRAGWAASAAVQRTPLPADRRSALAGVSLRATLGWSVASALVAASLAVMVMWRSLPRTTDPPVASAVNVVGEPKRTIDGQANQPAPALADAGHSRLGRKLPVDWAVSLLILRDRALRDRALGQRWDDQRVASDDTLGTTFTDEGISSRAKTSREILNELIPGATVPSALRGGAAQPGLPLPWNTSQLGETT